MDSFAGEYAAEDAAKRVYIVENHITTLAVRVGIFNLDLLQIPQGTGSGLIWDQDGHIVTNYHVIQGADAAINPGRTVQIRFGHRTGRGPLARDARRAEGACEGVRPFVPTS